MLTVSRKLAKILTDSRKSHHPIETLREQQHIHANIVVQQFYYRKYYSYFASNFLIKIIYMEKLRASDYASVAHPFLTSKRSCFTFAQVPRVARGLLCARFVCCLIRQDYGF